MASTPRTTADQGDPTGAAGARHAGPADPARKRKAVAAAAIGNFLEHYDFYLFAAYATVFAAIIFPQSNQLAGLLYTFAIYGVAFVGRPLGALVFGHFGDRLGRRNTLAASILLMVGATVMIGVSPSFESVGVFAALWLFVARLLQGVALGGEFAGATSYLVELAPPNRRAFYGSFNTFTVGLALLSGTLVAALISAVLPPEAVQDWGWRIPFLLAAPLGAVGLYLRLRLDESPEFTALAERNETAKAPLALTLRRYWQPILVALGVTVVWTVSAFVVLVYAGTYLATQTDLSFGASLAVQAVALAVYTIVVPLSASLADRVGRRPVLITGATMFLLLSIPGFLMLQTGDIVLIVLGCSMLSGTVGVFAGPAPTALAEMFDTKVRYSALGIGFNLSVALFGGTAPLIATALIGATGTPLAPSFYLTAGALVTLVVLLLVVRETVRQPLRTG
ncbi:MFS transporter [Pseudonocardia thermophila]|jgi:Arabinose efflux permease|uniref:MFS transporter n=1 Tax=Pseudonocardia thermophila TaxID=1848 RepID=UPI00248DE28D|nr:MFS transporter [Pseudonocardia thermophila]